MTGEFSFYLELARRLPWDFEHLPAETREARGEDALAEWKAALERRAVGGGLGIYCHIPYCATRCDYCHCFSRGGASRRDVVGYLQLLSIEIDLWGSALGRLPFTTAYIGGGTPTILIPKDLDALLGRLRGAFRFADRAQMTVEATPRTADPERLAVLRAHGVQRLSLGVQSLDPKVLSQAQRSWQTRTMVENAHRAARDAGFPVVNCDLIAGLKDQSESSFLSDARALAGIGFDTIHVYALEPDGESHNNGRRLVRDGSWRRRRDRMLGSVGPVLSALGYHALLGETIYARRKDAMNRYDFERYFQAASVLGLGWRAESHVFPGVHAAPLSLESWRDNLRAGRLPPVRLSRGGLDREMRDHLIFLLKRGVDIEVFRRLFGQRPQEAFPDAFAALRRAGRLREDSRRVRAVFGSQVEYLAVTLHFFPAEDLARLSA